MSRAERRKEAAKLKDQAARIAASDRTAKQPAPSAVADVRMPAAYARAMSPLGWVAVAMLIVLHLVLANAAAWHKCATFDEASHIANGYSIWKTGDYRMFPVALAQQRWMTLPLYLQDVPAPGTDQPLWSAADNWGYGRELLYGIGNDGASILRQVRFMTSLLSGVLALMVFCAARKLFGTAGGFVSLVLYCFNPTVLANAALATIDMSASLAFFAAMTTLWNVLQRFTLGRLLLSALVWGLAFCAKFSTPLLIPMAFLLVAVRVFDGRSWDAKFLQPATGNSYGRKAAYSLLVAMVHVVGVWLVIWALFGFQFQTFRDFPNDKREIYTGSFEDVTEKAPQYTELLRFARRKHLFPEAFLYAFADTMRTTNARSSYLDGWYGVYGFKSFFPLAFLYKTPLAVFGVLLLGLGAHAARRFHQIRVQQRSALSLLWEGMYAVLPLLAILVVYGATAVFSGMNIGIRHILPMFAPLFVLGGLAGEWLTAAWRRFRPQPSEATPRKATHEPTGAGELETAPPAGWPSCHDVVLRLACGAVVFLLAASIVNTAVAFPNYIAYFNAASGGIDGGHKHLVDSSLDWGQDLPALKEWLDQQGLIEGPKSQRIYLSYFGTTPPSAAGFKLATLTEPGVALLPGFIDRNTLEPGIRQRPELELSEGIYCISATMLQSVYLGAWSGPWTEQNERMYIEVRQEIHRFEEIQRDPVRQAEEARKNPRYWLNVLADFERLRFGRLCATLRHRDPIQIVNGSILVYRLSKPELDRAVNDPIEVRPNPAYDGAPIEY